MRDWLLPVITLLLGGGGLAFFTTMFRGVGSLRSGARAQERAAVADLGKSRAEERELRRVAERDLDYWRSTAYRYMGQLLRNGIEPVPLEPVPPSERAGQPLRPRPPGSKHALRDDEESE